MPRVAVKLHTSGQYRLVALCDEELLGKEVIHGRVRVKITREFFGGVIMEDSSPELEAMILGADCVTAFGRVCVERLAELFPSVHDAAVDIGGVPHVQIFKIPTP